MIESGVIRPPIGATYSLDDFPRALYDLDQRRALGKLVVHPTADRGEAPRRPRSGRTSPPTHPPPTSAGAGLGSLLVSILDDARSGMNPAIRPQDDLFGHVNGTWLDEAEIPADRSSWGPFVQLADVAEEQVHAIIEDLTARSAAGETGLSEDAAKIAALYASFMDEDAIAARGHRAAAADPGGGRPAAAT